MRSSSHHSRDAISQIIYASLGKEHREKNAAAAIFIDPSVRSPRVSGSMAIDMYRSLLNTATEMGFPTVEEWWHSNQSAMREAFNECFVVDCAHFKMSPAEREAIEKVHVYGDKCVLCGGKTMDWGHAGSGRHQERLALVHALNKVAGVTASGRRMLHTGFKSYPCRQTAMEFWGMELEEMPKRAMARFEATGGVNIRGSTSQKTKKVPVLGCSLSLVPYFPGCSKYMESQAIRWSELAMDALSASTNTILPLKEDQSYWPTLSLQLQPGVVADGGGGGYHVCIYQLVTSPIEAWWASDMATVAASPLPPPKADAGVFREPSVLRG